MTRHRSCETILFGLALVVIAGCSCGPVTDGSDAGTEQDARAPADAAPDGWAAHCAEAASPEVVETFLRAAATVYCTSIGSCEGSRFHNWRSVDDCVTEDRGFGSRSHDGVLWPWPEVAALAAAGRVAVDDSEMTECLRGIGEVCGRNDRLGPVGTILLDLDSDAKAACRAALRLCEPRGVGDACDRDWECEAGLECLPQPGCPAACCSPTVCSTPAHPGDPCLAAECAAPDADLAVCYLAPGATTGRCLAVAVADPVGEGEACGILEVDGAAGVAVPCEPNLLCGEGTCVRFRAAGEGCNFEALRCGPGTLCDYLERQCVAAFGPDAIGAECGYFCGTAQAGTVCVSGRCEATDGSAGSRCARFTNDCQPGLYCDDFGRCVESRPAGAECSAGVECLSSCCEDGRCS